MTVSAEGEDQSHDSLMEIMAGLLPSSKRMNESHEADKPAKIQKPGKGKGYGRPRKDKEATNQEGSLLNMVARLLIAHEDTLLALLLESEFMVFMQANGSGSLGPTMLALSQKWHAEIATEAVPKVPLRMLTLAAVFKELEMRLIKLMAENPEGAEIRRQLSAQNLLTADGKAWYYMKWDREQGKLLPTKETPLQMSDACQVLARVYALVQTPGLILRFCALKALNKVDMENPSSAFAIVPWKLTVSMRNPQAAELFQALTRLSHNAIMQVILTWLRPATLQRSPVAQAIAKQVFKARA
eukprot:s68_g7.t1